MNHKLILLILFSLFYFNVDGQEVISSSFISPALNDNSYPLNVYLPEGYDESNPPYNLYVFLHGCCGLDHQTHINEFRGRLNALIADGIIDPIVVAFPSVQGADYGNRHMWFNSDRNGNYGDLVVEDLMNHLNSTYNVSLDNRAIGGFSMGADGALRLGLHHSDKYAALISHSSYSAIENFENVVPGILDETSQGAPPYSYDPNNGLFTTVIFGVSTVWSPNLSNPPHLVDFPLDENGEIREDIFLKWKSIASPDSIIRQNWDANSGTIPISIYFDVGSQESIFTLYQTNNLLNDQIENLVQDEGFDINYQFNVFNEGHSLSLARIDSSLIWLNNVFESTVTSNDDIIQDLSTSVKIYPNPVNDFIKISFGDNILEKPSYLQIVNKMGQIEKKMELGQYESSTYSVDLSFLSKGIYLILFMNREHKVFAEKRIVKLE